MMGARSTHSPDFLNREISWLRFNQRVLALAERRVVPLLERLKFVAIASANLDEFFMVRVGSLERQLHRQERRDNRGSDGMTQGEVLQAISEFTTGISNDIARILSDRILPELRTHGVEFAKASQLTQTQIETIRDFYIREVQPCLTPIAIDPTHPFPQLRGGTLNVALELTPSTKRPRSSFHPSDSPQLAIVPVPSVLPRFVRLAADDVRYRFIALEDVICLFAEALFPGNTVGEACPFRVTRASDLDISEEEASNLLSTIEDELRRRDRGEIVRLEISHEASAPLAEHLRERLELKSRQIHRQVSFIAPSAFRSVYGQIALPDLRDTPFTPTSSSQLLYAPTIFRTLAERDILLHHPYESFRHVVDFLDQAAIDPNVVAIKQTLYRTSGDSPIVKALARAAEAGKQVTALIELKARFDEAANIAWARALEQSGVHVVYGVVGLKTHCKILLVIRREGDELKRYVHLGTGNYNPSTARLYTDLGLFTSNEEITWDALLLFNVLTGYAELPELKRLKVAPFTLREFFLAAIQREIEHARAGRPAGIKAKMNALVDPEIIRHLYRASRAGVKIDLMIRGICCLRPKVQGISENITVRSVVDRFLEHARIFWWANGGDDEIYLSSADWMPRNIHRRIEVAFPVLDPDIKRRIIEEVLPFEWSDNYFGWELEPDGHYVPREPGPGEAITRAQIKFMDLAKARAKTTRTTLRPELPGASFPSPALRAARAHARRRHDDDT